MMSQQSEPDILDDRRALRTWLRVAVAVAVVGLATAFVADAPWYERHDNFNEAWRESGGAVFAGAVISILVLVFEQRREIQRIARDQARSEELETAALERALDATARAWRREVDIKLITVVEGELQRELGDRRAEMRERVEEARRRQQHTPLGRSVYSSGSMFRPVVGRSFREMTDEAVALLLMLRDDDLAAGWLKWENSWDALYAAADAVDNLGLPGALVTLNRIDFDALFAAEGQDWDAFKRILTAHIDRWYPRTLPMGPASST